MSANIASALVNDVTLVWPCVGLDNQRIHPMVEGRCEQGSHFKEPAVMRG